MFRNRLPPPTLSPVERTVALEAHEQPQKRTAMNKVYTKAVIDRLIARGVLVYNSFTEQVYTAEHMLMDYSRKWDELNEIEADYFIGKLLGKDVVIEPIAPSMLASPLQCVNRTTGTLYAPTVDRAIMEELCDKHCIVLHHSEEGWVAKGSVSQHTASNPGMAIMRLVLKRDEPYLVTYQ